MVIAKTGADIHARNSEGETAGDLSFFFLYDDFFCFFFGGGVVFMNLFSKSPSTLSENLKNSGTVQND